MGLIVRNQSKKPFHSSISKGLSKQKLQDSQLKLVKIIRKIEKLRKKIWGIELKEPFPRKKQNQQREEKEELCDKIQQPPLEERRIVKIRYLKDPNECEEKMEGKFLRILNIFHGSLLHVFFGHSGKFSIDAKMRFLYSF